MTPQALDALLIRIETCPRNELPMLWAEHTTGPCPKPPQFCRYLLAWRLQAAMYGGLSAQTKRRIQELAKAYAKDFNYRPPGVPALKPGTEFVRHWDGTPHRVRVLDSGFDYQGETFQSLSEIARKITGTRWSGPKFFGLKKQVVR